MRSRLPQENPHRVHRKDEPRPDSRHTPSSRRLTMAKFLRVATSCPEGQYLWVAASQVAEKCGFRPSGVKTPEENAAFMSCLKARPTKLKSFPQPVKPNSKIHFSAGQKSQWENPCAKRFGSVGLQADTLDSSTCPPEGGRYIDQ